MKKFAIALLLACAVASPAAAGEGNVSNRALSNMGLSGLRVMSDSEGMNVRGMGFVAVSGTGSLRIGNDYRKDSYIAVGHHRASGGSANFLVNVSHHKVTAAASGGIAFAHAH